MAVGFAGVLAWAGVGQATGSKIREYTSRGDCRHSYCSGFAAAIRAGGVGTFSHAHRHVVATIRCRGGSGDDIRPTRTPQKDDFVIVPKQIYWLGILTGAAC